MYKLRSKIIIIINKYSYIIQSPDVYSFNKQTTYNSANLDQILYGEFWVGNWEMISKVTASVVLLHSIEYLLPNIPNVKIAKLLL